MCRRATKITLAHIGMGTQSFSELGSLLANPRIQIVAICDPNENGSDYVEWSKNSIRNRLRGYLGKPNWRENDTGVPGGREVGREVVETYYANQRAAEKFKAVKTYADYREMFDKEKDMDMVKVMTPDHHHAPACIAAMKLGKHTLVHKPLSNRMYEAEAGHRDRPQDGRGNPPPGLRQRSRQCADLRADQAGRDRQAPGDPQLDEPAGMAAVHGTPQGHAGGAQGL